MEVLALAWSVGQALGGFRGDVVVAVLPAAGESYGEVPSFGVVGMILDRRDGCLDRYWASDFMGSRKCLELAWFGEFFHDDNSFG